MSFTLYAKTLLERFLENEQGAELAEYAVGVALLVAITVVVFQVLGDAIVDENTGTGARIEGATWTPPSP
jgi:Flp pilus assembly pilin Flp